MSRPRADAPGVTESEALTWVATDRWVRGRLDGTVVVDSRAPIMVWEEGGRPHPRYAFPVGDVAEGALTLASEAPPAGRPARLDWFDLTTEGRTKRHAAWTWEAPELDGYVSFDWDAVDSWLEEDEEIIGHARDPYHRIDVRRSSRHVRISLDGTVLAETQHPLLLFETGLPTRYYLPQEDVATDLLEESDRTTICPYKGVASYWTVMIDGVERGDLAWAYEDPFPSQERIAGRVAFFDEKVDVEVDGEKQQRPTTVWS